jgi:hypothetical protein
LSDPALAPFSKQGASSNPGDGDQQESRLVTKVRFPPFPDFQAERPLPTHCRHSLMGREFAAVIVIAVIVIAVSVTDTGQPCKELLTDKSL